METRNWELAQLAFDRAVRLFRLALDWCPPEDARIQGLREALAEALVTAGHGAEAAEAFGAAADTAPPDRALELRRSATEQLLFAGRLDEGSAALRRCLGDAGFVVPAGASRRFLGFAWGLVVLMARGFGFRPRPAAEVDPRLLLRIDTLAVGARAFGITDPVLAIYLGVHGLRAALAAGEARRVAEALGLFSAYLVTVGRSAEWMARRVREPLARLAASREDPRIARMFALVSANEALQAGDTEAARAPLAAAAEAIERLHLGAGSEVNLHRELTCMHLHWSGAWGTLADTLRIILDAARGHGNLYLERSLRNWFGYVPHVVADDPEAAFRELHAARASWGVAHTCGLDHMSFLAEADVALYAEHGAGALAHRLYEERQRRLEGAQLHRLEGFAKHQLQIRGRAALAFVAGHPPGGEERRTAERIAARCAAALRRLRSPLTSAFAALLEAGLAAVRGDREAAVKLYTRAEESYAALGWAHYTAATRWRRGRLLGGAAGEALVAEAEATLAALGAQNPARLAAGLSPGL